MEIFSDSISPCNLQCKRVSEKGRPERKHFVSSIISVFQTLLFLICMGGYMLFLCDRYRIQPMFAPAVVFSSVICALTFAGYLNVLLFTSVVIYIVGGILFVFYLFQTIKKRIDFRTVFQTVPKLSMIFFFALFVYFVFLLRGARFTSYDDFSHWGVVVKEMLLFHRMPNAQSAVIDFKTYPLSSSLFIYFTDLVIGQTESKMLIAQMMLNLSYGAAFCGILRRSRNTLLQSIVLLTSVLMIAGFIGYWRLWVDALLPLSAVAAAAVIIYNRNDIRRACLTVLPILAAMGLMKNSGLYFVLVISFLLLYRTWKAKPTERGNKQTLVCWGYALGTVAFACMMVYLWHAHTNYVFPDQTTKHTISLYNFETVFQNKTNDEVQAIVRAFVNQARSLHTVSTSFLLTVNLSVAGFSLLLYFLWRIRPTTMLKALVFSDGVLIAYLVGMLGIYLFSMPTEEALRLAAYDRYASSVVIFQLGMVGIGLILTLEPLWLAVDDQNNKIAARHRFRRAFSGGCALLLLWGCGHVAIGGKYGIFYSKPDYQQSLPAALDRLLPENNAGYTDRRYLICNMADEPQVWYTNGYLRYIAQYKLYSPQISVFTEFNLSRLLKKLPEYDDLVITHSNREMDRFMAKYGKKAPIEGVYPIRETFPELFDP